MNVTELSWKNYRTLKQGTMAPCEDVNVIFGENAQGKTNLLEAIWVFTGGRSFRGAKDENLISFGKDHAKAAISFFAENRGQESELLLRAAKPGAPVRRSYTLNGVAQKSPSGMVGRFCACVFAPVHLSLVEAGPAERRKFLEGAICQAKPGAAQTLACYRRAVEQRNALLKEISRRPYLENTLDEWDEVLAPLGGAVISDRLLYLSQLQPASEEFYFGISSGREKLSVSYEFSFPEHAEQPAEAARFAEDFLGALRQNRRADLAAGFTTCGPHRDDFSLCINGLSARTFGSQGQKRSAALALKLGEAAVLRRNLGEKPVVLFDDVMSELDRSRQDYLFNRMKGWQIFITCCEPAAVLRLSGGKTFCMSDGVLSEQ